MPPMTIVDALAVGFIAGTIVGSRLAFWIANKVLDSIGIPRPNNNWWR